MSASTLVSLQTLVNEAHPTLDAADDMASAHIPTLLREHPATDAGNGWKHRSTHHLNNLRLLLQPYHAALSCSPIFALACWSPGSHSSPTLMPRRCSPASVTSSARANVRSIPLPSGCPDRLLSICAHRLPAAGGRAVRRAAAAPDWAGRAIGSPHIRAGARDSLCGSSAAQFSCGACAQASAGDARPYVSPVTLCHLLAYPERGGVVASSGHLSSETPSLWRADDVLLVWRLERRDAQHPMAKDSQRPSNYRTQFFERVF